MIKLWGRASSNNVQKALWALLETGEPFERIDVGGKFGGLAAPEFRALNPNGTIPVLQDADLTIWESHAIVRYVSARYSSGVLWPEEPGARSHADRWMEWTNAHQQPAYMGLFWALVRTPPAMRNAGRIATLTQQCADFYRLLDAHLAARPYLAGDTFTMGDIPAGASLYRYFAMEIERPALPNVERWRAQLEARPAYRAAVMVPFDELVGRLSF